MGKKEHGWPEAKRLCRLNQNNIAMAKALGFGPDALVRARPDPKQKWKLPVKEWIHELHLERFGYVLGERPSVAGLEDDAQVARSFDEQVYWEDYSERNDDNAPGRESGKQRAPVTSLFSPAEQGGAGWHARRLRPGLHRRRPAILR